MPAIRVNVTPALYEEVVRVADLHHVSQADVMRRALRLYLMEKTPTTFAEGAAMRHGRGEQA